MIKITVIITKNVLGSVRLSLFAAIYGLTPKNYCTISRIIICPFHGGLLGGKKNCTHGNSNKCGEDKHMKRTCCVCARN